MINMESKCKLCGKAVSGVEGAEVMHMKCAEESLKVQRERVKRIHAEHLAKQRKRV